LKYLSEYDHLFQIPREKKNQDYKRYLDSLFEYLYGYLERVKPLLDIRNEVEKAVEDFEKKWSEGTFPGWPVIFYIIYHIYILLLIKNLLFLYVLYL
jgi:splicing factor 3A subunit 3